MRKNENNMLKDFIFNYFDKKIESGKWKWVEKNGDTFLIDSDKYTIILELEKLKNLWAYKEIYDKFIEGFSIEWSDFKPIITSYVENRLNIEGINTAYRTIQWLTDVENKFNVEETISHSNFTIQYFRLKKR